MNYFFTDFTEKNYEKILLLTKENYSFVFFNKLENNEIIWRHDVDFSIHRALQLAKIESDNKVKSTYFILLSSFFYNIFEKEILHIIEKIIQYGHTIALHFDPTLYKIGSKNELEKYLTFEKNILENLFDISIDVFSFHNPTEEILKYDDFKYANMINTYAKYFKDEVAYCSDSNGYWRFERLEDFLQKGHKKVQVLTHPVWWQKEAMSPRERIQLSIDGRKKSQEQLYDGFLDENGRKNIK